MESTNFENPLKELNSLRQQVDIAETTDQMREIHQRISQVIDENPRLPLPEIAEALGVKVEKERKGVKLQIYATLKNIRPDIFDTESLPEEIQAIEDKFGEQGVYFKKLDIVITPPNKSSHKITQGSGNGIEDKRIYDRVDLAIEVLTSMGINLFECPPFSYGTITDNMMRKTTYVHIKIPQLNKMIHICDEEGNRTFVIYTCENEKQYIEMAKDKLKEDPLVRNFIWNENIDKWKMRLLTLLQNPIQPNDNDENTDNSPPDTASEIKKIDREYFEDTDDSTPGKPQETQKMDREYFENPDNMRADLGALAQQLSKNKMPLGLNTGNIVKLKITCSNGEKVKGRTYISRAGVALELAKGTEEAKFKHKEILKTLLKIAGFEIMDKKYFKNPENVRADLETLAQQLGEDKTPLDLSTNNTRKTKITYSNGEEITGVRYLNRAGIALELAKGTEEARSKHKKILKALLEIAGFEIMDKKYFENPENIRADVEALAQQLGEDKTPLDLTTTKIRKLKITCSNGEKVKGPAYILRIRIALGFGKSKGIDILKTLKQIAGY